MYVKRDSAGAIVAISKLADAAFTESLIDGSAELLAFIDNAKSIGQRELEQTDQTMARVMEDVVNLLVEQDVIRFTDLPDAAQHKLLNRRELRGKRQGIDLLDDGDDLRL